MFWLICLHFMKVLIIFYGLVYGLNVAVTQKTAIFVPINLESLSIKFCYLIFSRLILFYNKILINGDVRITNLVIFTSILSIVAQGKMALSSLRRAINLVPRVMTPVVANQRFCKYDLH